MLSMFAPRYVKEGKAVLKNARKLLHYKRDVLSAASVADFELSLEKLRHAIKTRDRRMTEEATEQIDAQWSSYLPPAKDAGWRENCEVFLVAIVIAIGVRTYFLQPFTIPTGSMQPTLNGIIGFATAEPPPNPIMRVLDFAIKGRSYVNVVATSDDRVVALEEHGFLYFFTKTTIVCERGKYTAWIPRDTIARDPFGVTPGREFRAGDVLARGYANAGDHVFVDKVSYHFHPPERGDVFVFKTTDIRFIEEQLALSNVEGSQFYIKRLAALPGDEMRIDPPRLYINGQPARGAGFARVMEAEGDYHGYTSGPPGRLLSNPEQTFQLPEHRYFALGDNSRNSSDSRYWGTVPEPNIMGRGLFVYWPFTSHWGPIR